MSFGPAKHVETKDLFRLDGRTILITGGGGGVGLEIAGAIIESGGDVVLLDIHADLDYPTNPLLENWRHLRALAVASDAHLYYHRADATSAADLEALFSTHLTTLRHPLRGLVTCAGISGEAPASAYPSADFRRIVDVNLTGTFLTAQAFARHLQAHPHPPQHPGTATATASIVLVASMSAHVANAGLATSAYNASKAALLQLARSLAAEWGRPSASASASASLSPSPSTAFSSAPPGVSIRVNTLSPGYILTPISAEALSRPGRASQCASENMLGRLSTPGEYRAPVLFLLGEGSSFVTGADVRVDGGHCAW